MKLSLKTKRRLILLASLCVLVAAIVVTVPAFRKPPEGVSGKVVRADLIQRVTLSGSVVPNRKTVLSASYAGYVRKIYVKVGDTVRAGAPIVSVAQSLGSGDEVFPLRAPFAGTVVQILKTEGEYVEAGQQSGLVRIDDLSRLFVEAASPEIEVGKLKIGQEAEIKTSAVLTRSYHGKIQHISLAARDQKDWDRSRVEFPVTMEIADPDSQIKPGMSVVVDVVARKASGVLTLKHEFVEKAGDKYFVTTLEGRRKPIEVGLQNEEAFEIKSGVGEGDKLRPTNFLAVPSEP